MHYDDEMFGFVDAWDGVMDQRYVDLTVECDPGHAAQGRHPARHPAGQPVRPPDGLALVKAGVRGAGARRPHRHRRQRLAHRLPPAVRAARPPDRGRAQDDRQRHRGHRGHLRLPHRRADRHRRHRPPPHHGREPRPGDGGRGDGPPRRLDRHLRRHRRRRHGHPHPRAAVRHRRGVQTIRRRHKRGRYASIVVVAEGAVPKAGTMAVEERRHRPARPRQARRHRLRDRAARSRSAPASRPGSWCSATSSGAARPSAYDRVLSTRYGLAAIDAVHEEAWGQMVVFRTQHMRSRRCRSRSARPAPSTADVRGRGRGVLRLTVFFG